MTREINEGERTGERQEWRTGRTLAAAIVKRYAVDLDAMALMGNAVCPCYISDPKEGLPAGTHCAESPMPIAVDALRVKWSDYGTSIFVNPPFSLLARVVAKMIEASRHASVVMLAPDNGDTRWYAALVDAGAVVGRFRGRVEYEPARRILPVVGDLVVDAVFDEKPIRQSGAAFPSALYRLTPMSKPRAPGADVPTQILDPRTCEVL